MIQDRPETAVKSDSAGNFYILEVRQSYAMRWNWPHNERNFPQTREKCFYASISHPNYEGVTFDIIEQQREWPKGVREPHLLKDVFLVPKQQ